MGGQIEDMEGLLAFPVRSPERPGLEIRVNFGMFAGREATAAEMQELGTALLAAIDNADLSAETHFEIGPDTEAEVHQVRIEVPAESLPADDFRDRRARRPADRDRGALGARLHRRAARRGQRAVTAPAAASHCALFAARRAYALSGCGERPPCPGGAQREARHRAPHLLRLADDLVERVREPVDVVLGERRAAAGP